MNVGARSQKPAFHGFNLNNAKKIKSIKNYYKVYLRDLDVILTNSLATKAPVLIPAPI